ncbi:hypothetical protein OG422_11515 [Streptomyces sp. NBC_01525]|uniref:Uncharacterized protein n=1 Tax=Streptomyces benahoarensis TaxID=2595054 RepID=A0A553ZP37_9ACTN|nr:hypothetical protein [Streptomyces benahoarensis]TSB22188.1 hypothetical protein FNJ62_16645 [Streptomyces benahoarensis]TSB43229.1 hypothetical protein FNZ23_05670 [Streptomyces benahoarensis]
MTTPVDAERAWQDLQRIRVPQERVYDEVERGASGEAATTYITATLMWLFVASWGLTLPDWIFWLLTVAYVVLLGTLITFAARRARVRLHRSRHTWRSVASALAGAVVSLTTLLLSGFLARSLHLPLPTVIQATVSVGVHLLCVGPANRWTRSALRSHGARLDPSGSRPAPTAP